MVIYTNREYWYNDGSSFTCEKDTQIVYLTTSPTPTNFDIAYLPYSNSGNVQSDVGIGYNVYFIDTTGNNNSITIQTQATEYINGTYSYTLTNPAFTTTVCTNLGNGVWSILNTANISNGSNVQGATGPQGATGTNYNFDYGLTVSGLTVSVDSNIIATSATLSNYATIAALNTHFSNGGDSFGATATIGTLDNQNMQIILNNTLVARFFTQSSNASTGPGQNVFAILGNTATASGVLTPLGVSNVWIQGISTQAANTALLTTFNSGAGSGVFRPHIRMINGAGQAVSIGMLDNSQSIVFGRNSDTFLTLGSGGSTFNVSASSAAQNSVTVQASHQNSSGISVALLVNNTGSNSSTGGVSTFRINNTETLNGSGEMLLVDAQRSSNSVFKINMSGAIAAGTVSNATQSFWKLGKIVTTPSTVDTTKYIEISIDGTVYKVATMS
jgi:hypothetical protein